MSPKEECEELINTLLPMGTKLLQKYGEFYPYCAVMKNDGTITIVDYFDGNEHPISKDVIDDLQNVLRQYATKGEIKATGIAWNSSVTSANQVSDAIVISLEHHDHYSVKIAVPYKKMFPRRLKVGALMAFEGENNIFRFG